MLRRILTLLLKSQFWRARFEETKGIFAPTEKLRADLQIKDLLLESVL